MLSTLRQKFDRTEWKILFSLFAYVTLIYFVISPDSYTQDVMNHYDSSCFFICGKAWMNGMTPYVDFADSKGPLLWLITGVGYLISHHDYIGVFWLACLWYTVTLHLCYRIGRLLTGNRVQGYVVALLMGCAYFLYVYHYETRAEDWCQPFIAAALYVLLRELKRPGQYGETGAGVVMGLSFMAAFLIKWSIAVMIFSFVASYLLIRLLRREGVARFCLSFIASAAVLFLPFLIYMLATDSLGAFVQEYFLNTSRTVSSGGLMGSIATYAADVLAAFVPKRLDVWEVWRRVVYLIALVGTWVYYRKHREMTCLPLLCGLFFLALASLHNYNYYYHVLMVFFIFTAAMLAPWLMPERLTSQRPRRRLKFIAAALIVLNWTNVSTGIMVGNMFFQTEQRLGFYQAAYVVAQIEDAKVCTDGVDQGLGISSNCLPAMLYWTRQNGQTDAMRKSRVQAKIDSVPDFIIVDCWLTRKVSVPSYYKLYVAYENGHKSLLYGRPGLKLPPKDFNVSDWDVLLKRRVFAKD